jgi:transcription antitermination factor NusG
MMMRPVRDLSERELIELERARQKAELVAWLRREAASRDGTMAWYVARTNWRADSVAEELRASGIEAVCPKERRWKRFPRSNRRYSVDIPIFGQYLFVRLLKAESAWVGVLTFDGVACLQGNGERPVEMPKSEIEKILEMLADAGAEPVRDATEIMVGDRVIHPLGLFAELHGVVCQIDAEKREAIVSTVLFGREVATRCHVDDLAKLS